MNTFRSATPAAVVLCLSLLLPSSVGDVLFSSLPESLVVSASPKPGQVLKAGEDNISVSWGLNQSLPAGADADYKKMEIRLCYAPSSQVDRAWRKTNDDLSKDKACQFGITIQPYSNSNNKNQSFDYTVERDVPTAIYFVRAYALDSGDNQVAYGQTTDAHNTANLFEVQGVTGRHAYLDIAAGCFSAFSVASLIVFFMIEKRKVKK